LFHYTCFKLSYLNVFKNSGNDLAMDFVDKIPIPKSNGVTMRGPHVPNTSTGTLVITRHHLIFSSISEDVELWVNCNNLILGFSIHTFISF